MTAVIGRLGYIRPIGEVVFSHPSCNPELENLDWDWRDVEIGDARRVEGGGCTLERHGFTTMPHPTAVTNWEGTAWQPQFDQEAVAMVQQATGAAKVVVSHYSFLPRSTRFAAEGGPLGFCHNDYTGGSAARHIARDCPELAPDFLKKRFAIYNLWHLISPPPQSVPLALCDATTVAIADLIPAEARAGTKEKPFVFGENSMFRYSPRHRWYYYPDLRNDETLVWCGYDSDPQFPSIVPHAAFKDPSVNDPKAERTNVHGAVYAFFD
jgi:hypothetical protein